MRKTVPAYQIMAFTYPVLGYCPMHPKDEVVVVEYDHRTGVKNRMCRTCWNIHRGRKKP